MLRGDRPELVVIARPTGMESFAEPRSPCWSSTVQGASGSAS